MREEKDRDRACMYVCMYVYTYVCVCAGAIDRECVVCKSGADALDDPGIGGLMDGLLARDQSQLYILLTIYLSKSNLLKSSTVPV